MRKILPYFYLVLAAIFTGAIGTFVKLLGNDVHFMTIVFYRMLLAFIFVLIVVPFMDKKAFKVTVKDVRDYFFVGVIAAITFSLFVVANVYAPVQNVVLITSFAPFFVLIWAYFFLKESITKTKIVTLLIAIVGLVILNPFQFGANSIGNFIALGQALFYSFLIVGMREINRDHGIGAVIWFFFFSTLVLLPFPFIFGWGDLSGLNLWYILILGIASTGIAYLFHNMGLQKIGAEISAIVIMIIMPLSAITIAYFVIGEALDLRVLIGGGILIFAGIYLQLHNKKLKKAVKEFVEDVVDLVRFS